MYKEVTFNTLQENAVKLKMMTMADAALGEFTGIWF